MTDLVSSVQDTGPHRVLRQKWDTHASEWINWVRAEDSPDSYWRFHRARFLALVPAPGELTVEIGCGEGRVGRDLQKRGHNVVGIDCSLAMCEAAAKHPDFASHPESAAVVAGDAARLPLADRSADCAIAFMCLHDMDNMPGAIAEIARVLRDGSQLALAIVHPMYSNGNFTNAEDGSGKSFVITRSYFESQLCVSTDRRDDLKVTFFREHRPLQDYVQALLKAGFTIDQLIEVTDEADRKPVPMFLDILATRTPRPDRPSAVARVTSRALLAARGTGRPALAGASFFLGVGLMALLAVLK